MVHLRSAIDHSKINKKKQKTSQLLQPLSNAEFSFVKGEVQFLMKYCEILNDSVENKAGNKNIKTRVTKKNCPPRNKKAPKIITKQRCPTFILKCLLSCV